MNKPRFRPVRRAAAAMVILILLALGLLPTTPPASAAPASPSPAPAGGIPTLRSTYDSFRLIHTRNVFDPDRRPLRPASTAAAVAPVTRADYAALTGTLLSAEKSYAFFSGSRPEFNKVLGVRGKIANATITGITGQNIEIEREGKRTTVAVGLTVPFDNQTAPGSPPVDVPAVGSTTDTVSSPGAAPAATPPATAARPAAGTAATASTAAKGPPPNLEEIRRRMMEKRQQELK